MNARRRLIFWSITAGLLALVGCWTPRYMRVKSSFRNSDAAILREQFGKPHASFDDAGELRDFVTTRLHVDWPLVVGPPTAPLSQDEQVQLKVLLGDATARHAINWLVFDDRQSFHYFRTVTVLGFVDDRLVVVATPMQRPTPYAPLLMELLNLPTSTEK